MPNAPKSRAVTDLVPGVIAAVGLLVLTLGLHLPFLLAFGAAALVYLGVWWLTPRTGTANGEVPAPSLDDTLNELQGLSSRVQSPDVRRQVQGIIDQARQIQVYLVGHPEQAGLWQDYVRECLGSAVAGTRQFVGLSAYLAGPTDPALVKFTEFLTTLSQTLSSVRQKLVAEDAASFATQIDTYKNTLRDINQVYLGGGNPE